MKKYLLPVIAGLSAVVALLIVLFIPKGQSEKPSGAYAEVTGSGDLVIRATDLSESDVTFLRVSKDSKVEFLAIRDNEGNARVALGTCQSCNGSPGAYYTQAGEVLRCNNCGLTFPLSVIEEPGGGCHPIMLEEEGVQQTSEGVVVSAELLNTYEPLFDMVEAH